ncbi:MAG: cysteine synthase A [Firmicutes bacterium]|nr:cysteine synthase A [Bacillota bacterium]
MKICTNFTELIGNTPLLEPRHYNELHAAEARLLLKLESMNPAGSIKDRVGAALIADGEARGLLKPGSVIIEPTSGNTGIGLAAAAASRGYRVILTMPETMSKERRDLLAAFGAEIVLTPGDAGMQGSVAKAEELAASIPGSFIPGQFVNPANSAVHEATTGPEIWRDTEGTVDILVACVGTGGTLTGTGRYLKTRNPSLEIIAVEPADSPLLSQGKAGPHKIQGIGANFIPEILDTGLYDSVAAVTAEDAYRAARELAKQEGILTGISSGAALACATAAARKPENRGKTVVCILPDTGDRYLSTELFSE